MPAGIGDNSISPGAQSQLKSVVERVERLLTEKSEITEQVKEVYLEAKGNGFDIKTIRKIVALRTKDKAKYLEEKAILELYAHALGVEDLV